VTRIVLDTDVVSYHRAGRLPAGHARLVAANPHCIAFATAGELWKGAQVKRWGGVRRDGLDLWLHEETILPASLRVARIWGTITAAAQRRGRPRPLNDSWIAACCIESGLPLLTLNRRDFADFADHDGLVLLSA
jgi:predicted nucleic acid-binding protein